jgi:hypothetical protein
VRSSKSFRSPFCCREHAELLLVGTNGASIEIDPGASPVRSIKPREPQRTFGASISAA